MITNDRIVDCWNSLTQAERSRIMIKYRVKEGEDPLVKNELKKYLQHHYISMKTVVTK
jgi:hypothetical protein